MGLAARSVHVAILHALLIGYFQAQIDRGDRSEWDDFVAWAEHRFAEPSKQSLWLRSLLIQRAGGDFDRGAAELLRLVDESLATRREP